MHRRVNQRIQKEITDLIRNLNDTFKVCCRNAFNYLFYFNGPSGSPYEDIPIVVNFIYPLNYPFDPPIIKFQTPLFHPNITSEGILEILTNIENWNCALTTSSLLLDILILLCKPLTCEEEEDVNDKGKEEMDEIPIQPYINQEALSLWQNDVEQFKAIVKINILN